MVKLQQAGEGPKAGGLAKRTSWCLSVEDQTEGLKHKWHCATIYGNGAELLFYHLIPSNICICSSGCFLSLDL